MEQSSKVSGAMVKSNRAANWAARSTLRGSSGKLLSSTCLITPAFKSSLPPLKSSISPVSTSIIMALIVKSLLLQDFSTGRKGSTSTSSSRWPAPVCLSFRGSAMSTLYPAMEKIPKFFPNSITSPISPIMDFSLSGSIPCISMSTSFIAEFPAEFPDVSVFTGFIS